MLFDKVDNKYYITCDRAKVLIEKLIESDKINMGAVIYLSGGKWDKIYESARRVYFEEGISPTIHTCGGQY